MQQRDINVVVLTGTVESTPTFITVKNNKRILLFTLRNLEHFELFDGKPAVHANFLTVEVLGSNADRYMKMLTEGMKCQISGYLRADELNGSDKVRIRAFRIEKATV